MVKPKLRFAFVEKEEKTERRTRGEGGLAAAAEKNRERSVRLGIVAAFNRLGVPHKQWPELVRSFHGDQLQQIEYHQSMMPSPFQAPDFDRLNETAQDWVRSADIAWKLHRNRFLKECEDWVSAGVDEAIPQMKRARGPGKRVSPRPGGRSRGVNSSLERRYEMAARYLLKVPIKEIAGADLDAATAGRVAREIVRSAGWADK
jgi:hypothetical protein